MSAALRRYGGGLPARIALGLLVPLALNLLWDHQARHGGEHAFAFVSAAQVAGALRELWQSGDLLTAYGNSLRNAFGGLFWGSVTGLAVGSAMALLRPVDWVLTPLYHGLRQVPLLGWLPLIGLWFGSGDLSKVIVVSLSAFYPAVLYTYEGLKGVEARMLEVGRLYRLTPWQTFWRIRWPSALPSIFTGLLQSVAFAWIATIGVELLFPTGFGLGTVMQHGQLQARLDIVVVCIAVVGLTGFAINLLVARLSRHALRWRPVRT
ncbi:MAG: ABC transporter permease [Methyloversatilis sp.]|nr:ABC transporter permease [Methyloversatilis sp.]